jgi:hypothetical protein
MLVDLNPRALTIPLKSRYPRWNRTSTGYSARTRIGHSIDPKDYIGIEPINTYVEPTIREYSYDAGRIVYFRNLIISGGYIDPIEAWIVDYEILISDGYHRLAGVCLAEQEIIKCKILKRINN